MLSILVKNTALQSWEYRNVTFPANEQISIDAILFNKLRNEFVPTYGTCGLVWDEAKLQTALQQFKSSCFSEFESLGIPVVKASVVAGNLSRGDKHLLAKEWLLSKEEAREDEAISIAKSASFAATAAAAAASEANAIARSNRRISIISVIVAIIAAIAAIKWK
jgi:hypothetical protein